MEVWKLVARIDGPESRRHRAEEWGHWFNQVMAKAGSIRGSLARPAGVPVAAQVVDVGRCQRGGGFLERVKLPQFSGSVEDYGEFKCQFQELCRGENYTRVIELAQLRQKLPKDAVALLVGLVSPDAAWARLDETYGNVDLQVFAALKRLRAFKPSKTAVQGQVVELAIAVQRCLTVLRALSREQDFLSDRETLAEVIDALPTDSQQRWYHRRGARNETQHEKGTNFLLWLEEERADAVAIHLDSLARRPKVPASQAATQKPAAGGGATDQSVFVATSAVQPSPGGSAAPVLVDPTTALTQGGGTVVKPKPPAQGLKSLRRLRHWEVAAKRKANLESKQLDKCPHLQITARVREGMVANDASSQGQDALDAAHVVSQVSGTVAGAEVGDSHGASRLPLVHVVGPCQSTSSADVNCPSPSVRWTSPDQNVAVATGSGSMSQAERLGTW